jgi:hypothetical protein
VTDLLPAVLMLPPAGSSPAEAWVARGRAAAAEDLVGRLRRSSAFGPVFSLAAEAADTERMAAAGAEPLAPPPGRFHFGATLAHLIHERNFTQLAYFGGASAPLAAEGSLRSAAELFHSQPKGTSVVNNLHSTDWGLLGAGEAVAARPERFPNDNMLGWVLSQEAGLPVVELPASAATRLDIDTPTDLLLAAGHPSAGPCLAAFLTQVPEGLLDICDRIRGVLRTPASHLTLIGRTSANAWAQLERRTQCWVRVFAEERGMLASGRLERGEVRSLLWALAEGGSPERLVQALAEISRAVLWDTRVWLAAAGSWPAAPDRFASDLGWVDQVEDVGLRRLTQAIRAAPIPILAGGHGVVAGGIYALLESMDAADFA